MQKNKQIVRLVFFGISNLGIVATTTCMLKMGREDYPTHTDRRIYRETDRQTDS